MYVCLYVCVWCIYAKIKLLWTLNLVICLQPEHGTVKETEEFRRNENKTCKMKNMIMGGSLGNGKTNTIIWVRLEVHLAEALGFWPWPPSSRCQTGALSEAWSTHLSGCQLQCSTKTQALLFLHMTNDFNLTVFLSCACQNFAHIIISFLGKGRNSYYTA